MVAGAPHRPTVRSERAVIGSSGKGAMKKLFRTAVVGIGVAAACLGLTQPAWANSFSKGLVDGSISYRDNGDRFCAHAYDTGGSRSITVKLTPISRSGPHFHWTDTNIFYDAGAPTGVCKSLARAHEDTRYRAEVWTYYAKRGTTVKRANFTFYS
jgi:hypothetical protein